MGILIFYSNSRHNEIHFSIANESQTSIIRHICFSYNSKVGHDIPTIRILPWKKRFQVDIKIMLVY